MYRRGNDPARSVYAVTPNVPLQGSGLLPSLPGLDRSKLPTFLSILADQELTHGEDGRKMAIAPETQTRSTGLLPWIANVRRRSGRN